LKWLYDIGIPDLIYRFLTGTDMIPIEMYHFWNSVILISFSRPAFPFPHKIYGNEIG
jgi:hypothetical protein